METHIFRISMHGIFISVANSKEDAKKKVENHIDKNIKEEFRTGFKKDIEYVRQLTDNDEAIRITRC